jgi:hypothetical protein
MSSLLRFFTLFSKQIEVNTAGSCYKYLAVRQPITMEELFLGKKELSQVLIVAVFLMNFAYTLCDRAREIGQFVCEFRTDILYDLNASFLSIFRIFFSLPVRF